MKFLYSIHTCVAAAMVVSLVFVDVAKSAYDDPAVAIRIVDNEVQVGTFEPSSYYLQWATPMGVWKNWDASTFLNFENPSLWLRGVFEPMEMVDTMDWEPPEHALLYSPAAVVPDEAGRHWFSVGRFGEDGQVYAQHAPEPLSFATASTPPVLSDEPKNNQAVATPDPGAVRLYWHNRTTRQPVVWHLGDSGLRKGGATVSAAYPASAWRIVGSADIDGDGTVDLVWHNSSTGRLVIWFLEPDGVLRRSQQVLDANLSTLWRVRGVEDMNGDGVPDLIFHNASTGRAVIWYLDAGGERIGSASVVDANVSTAWQIVGVADMNGDGNPDLVWHNAATGRALYWVLDNDGVYVSTVNILETAIATSWRVVGITDINGDSNPDIIWHHATTGRAHIWFLDGDGKWSSGVNIADVNLATAWQIKAVVDVNDDGTPDLVWHNTANGRTHTWFLDDTGRYVSGLDAISGGLATAWQIDSVSY